MSDDFKNPFLEDSEELPPGKAYHDDDELEDEAISKPVAPPNETYAKPLPPKKPNPNPITTSNPIPPRKPAITSQPRPADTQSASPSPATHASGELTPPPAKEAKNSGNLSIAFDVVVAAIAIVFFALLIKEIIPFFN